MSGVKWLFLTAAVLYLAILTIGALSGRVRLHRRNACCAPADPAKDLRMRDAG